MKDITTDRIRNVAIVGHGGSGKTMLVEHMLYTSGAIERVGSVESGSTQSDYDVIEVKRHISLNASVVPVEWHGTKINLIDVPGYPDFIGDLHAVARVVESMIIVCEAKHDIDVGFELAYEVAQAHGLATCIFINKLERDNADYEGLIQTLDERYGRKIVSTQIPIGHQAAFSGVLDLLNMKVYKGRDRGVEIEEVPTGYTAEADQRREKMMDAAAEGDDDLALKYLDGAPLTAEETEHGLLVGVETGRVIPVLLGSAATGIGVATLLDRIVGELPSPVDFAKRSESTSTDESEMRPEPSVDQPLSALCFKTTADPFVGRINYIRVFSGKLKADDQVVNVGKDHSERVHNLFFPSGKTQNPATEIIAGDICAFAKLNDILTGDTIGKLGTKKLPEIQYPEPIYRIAIRPNAKSDEDKLGSALTRILEEDPTLHYVREASTHQEILEGMGDIHLETVIEKLKVKFGVNVTIEEALIPYRETVRSTSKAQGRHKRQTGGKGQFGDCHIELMPLSRGDGFSFENKVVGGAIPKNFIPAIEKGIKETMERGFLAGYPAVDMKVIVYDGSYHDVDSNEAAFKSAGAIAIREAVAKAQPVILEPLMNIEVFVPRDSVGSVQGDLSSRRGHLVTTETLAGGVERIEAIVPMSSLARYALDLRSITKGRGRFRQQFSRYEELPHPESQKLVAAYAAKRAQHEEE